MFVINLFLEKKKTFTSNTVGKIHLRLLYTISWYLPQWQSNWTSEEHNRLMALLSQKPFFVLVCAHFLYWKQQQLYSILGLNTGPFQGLTNFQWISVAVVGRWAPKCSALARQAKYSLENLVAHLNYSTFGEDALVIIKKLHSPLLTWMQ